MSANAVLQRFLLTSYF